jgi:hypothetical protein
MTMHRRLFLAALLTTGLLAGCFPSLGPYYTEGQPFFDPRLPGEWVPDEDDDVTLKVERLADTDAYRITVHENEEVQYVLVGTLFTVEEVTFLDVAIDVQSWKADGNNSPECGRLLFRELSVPIHQLYRIEISAGEARLYLGDIDWIEGHLAGHPDALRHLRSDALLAFSDLLLTDKPDTLQAFFSRRSREAFDSDPGVYRKTPAASTISRVNSTTSRSVIRFQSDRRVPERSPDPRAQFSKLDPAFDDRRDHDAPPAVELPLSR